MALGHHLFPTSVFRLLNLDLISNHCPGVSVMQKSECEVGYPAIHPYNPAQNRCSGANQQVSIVLRKNLCSLELLTTPIVGNPPRPRDPPPPLQEVAIRDRMSNLSDRLILALTSEARDLDSGL